MKLLVLCVETDKEAQTNTKYIDKTIRQFYVIYNNIKIAQKNLMEKNGVGNNLLETRIYLKI